ncbi:MAG TPA: methionyl-tRNA formyltransferase [Patescibacteria group bacterium]
MKIIFFGTPEFVIPVAEALRKEFDHGVEKNLVAVVTQPAKPAGREQTMKYSPVDNWAYKHRIPIVRDLKNDELPEADLGVVAAYGEIIPQNVIDHFKYGIINIHPSLLPLFRGASPIQSAIASGETQTGVSVIKMDEQMDHGPIISYFKEDILSEDTNETLTKRLFERASDFVVNLIPNYVSGKIKLKEQDHSKATFTKVLKREDGFIDLEKGTAQEAERKIRAMQPWPGAWTKLENGKRLKLLKAHVENEKLILDEVQLEGKTPVTGEEFRRGYPDLKLGLNG